MTHARIPLSTYRLQFNSHFTFRDAEAVTHYLQSLGIGDCYASSYLMAVPGSPHGYDVVDPTRLNPDIGTDEDYQAWVDALKSCGMGHVVDVVPNHMGIAKSANPWWLDVLENGPSSRFARFFDIEWHPVKDELADKVLLPILGDQYGAVLECQELQLSFRDGAFVVRYYDDVLPIAPDTYGRVFDEAIECWSAAHPGEEADELLSILTSADALPARDSRSATAIATRAREKEVVKRRLRTLAARSREVSAFVEARVRQFNGVVGDPRSFDRLDALLNAQSYRLAHWRVASEEINYRRFFDVNQLAALRMEDPVVFDEVHRFIFELVDRGAVTGLRVDHVDGLFAPRDYLARLQARCGGADTSRPFFIIVEKILGSDEPLPADWPVQGTTGYEFAAMVNGLFVDRRNERAIDDIYRRFTRTKPSFADLAYRSRKRVLHETMSGDINSLAHRLNRFSERNRHFRDFTLYSLISALKEVLCCFPVYRTYVTPDDPVSARDARYIREATQTAKRRALGVPGVVFDFIGKLLLKDTVAASPDERDEHERFIGKFQQITSPVVAKAIEDTALYSFNRLVSLNEVGSDPTRFGCSPASVHDWMQERQRQWPSALSATSTHDTKRGEDVRARINVLSEIPAEWSEAIKKWRGINRRFKSDVNGAAAPDGNDEYLLYQTLVGAWPFESDAETHASFTERIIAYMTKAVRETKTHTSWLTPNDPYEAAVERFVRAVLDPSRPFLAAFLPFQARVAEIGIYNSLSQLLIKVAAPGIPDFYQGTELWDLTLVDPDNRRAVDYEWRNSVLSQMRPCPGRDANDSRLRELLDSRTDGRVKMFVTARALAARAAHRALFENGAYTPVQVSGDREDHVFAFARTSDRDTAIVCVPRLVASLCASMPATPPIGPAVWGNTRLTLADSPHRRFREVFTGARIDADAHGSAGSIAVAQALAAFPVALLVAEPGRELTALG